METWCNNIRRIQECDAWKETKFALKETLSKTSYAWFMRIFWESKTMTVHANGDIN